jgi:hypothetical protein
MLGGNRCHRPGRFVIEAREGREAAFPSSLPGMCILNEPKAHVWWTVASKILIFGPWHHVEPALGPEAPWDRPRVWPWGRVEGLHLIRHPWRIREWLTMSQGYAGQNHVALLLQTHDFCMQHEQHERQMYRSRRRLECVTSFPRLLNHPPGPGVRRA